MPPRWPIDVTALGHAAVGVKLWRAAGVRQLTVVVKAVFKLEPDASARPLPGPVVALKERHYGDSPRRSMEEGSDLAPFRPRCDVTLQGHAHAPPGQPVPTLVARLALVRGSPVLDKRVHVVGDRGAGGLPQPFQRMMLDYEHAFGGKSHKQNPVGRGADKNGPQNQPPNLVHPTHPEQVACFAPLSRYWGDRSRLLGSAARAEVDAEEATLGEAFDWSYFQAAPADQQVPFLHGDEWIVLDGVHPALPRVSSQLPNARGFALMYFFGEGGFGPASPIDLVADGLAIDADKLTASVVWRGRRELAAGVDLSRLRVFGAVQVDGAPIPWPNPRELAAPEAPAQEAPKAPALSDATVTLSTSAEGRAQRSAPTPFSPSPEAQAPVISEMPVSSQAASLGHTLSASQAEIVRGQKEAAPFSSKPTSVGPTSSPFEGTVALPPAPASEVVLPFSHSPPLVAPPTPAAPPASQPNLEQTFRLSSKASEEAASAPAVPFRPTDPDEPVAPPSFAAPMADEPSELGSTISLRPDQAGALLDAIAPFPIARPKPRPAPREGVPPRESPQVPIVNKTALGAATSSWQLAPPQDVLTLVIKGTFDLVDGGPASLRQESDPLSGDVYDDDDPTKSLLYPTDFAVMKPRADVLLIGHAQAPEGGATKARQVSFRFGAPPADGFERKLVVLGNRSWNGGVPGEAQPFERIPLTWERAFGGGADFAGNPAGTGRNGTPPPNLEDPERLLRTRDDAPQPVCFAPVSPQWPERRLCLGTYDESWLETRWPYFPKDFDPSHFQAAPRAQQLAALQGDEPYRITGLSDQTLEGTLPALRVRAFRLATEELGAELSEISLRLDTAIFEPDERKLTLLWRGLIEVSDDEAPEIETLFVHAEASDQLPLPLDQIQRLLWRAASPEPDEQQAPDAPSEPLSAEEGAAGRAAVVAALASGAVLDEMDLASLDLRGIDFEGCSLVSANLKDSMLTGCSLRGANLSGALLAGADLSDADLTEASLVEADLVGAKLERARLDGAQIDDADLSSAKADGASFVRARGEGALFAKSSLVGASFDQAELGSADLTDAKLDRATFHRAILPELKLYFASGERVVFDGSDLSEARADDADLVKSSFINVRAAGAVFEKAFLAGSTFVGADLTGASFCRASCEGVNFGRTEASESRFTRAKLKSAQFLKANLMEADFERADLTDADLRATNLHAAETWKAKLRGAKLDQAILTGTKLAPRGGRVG